MRTIRIIPRLDIKGPNLVKGIHFEGLRVLGLPERFSTNYFQDGADELLYIDSVASLYGRNNLEEIVRRTAENVFVPITVGGGIRTIDDIRLLLRAGADKIAINTQAVRNPQLITEGARVFGSQCIVVSIQAMKVGSGKYEAYTDNAREPTGKDVFDWARQAVELGAGEVLVTSIDQEGTGGGYDLDLVTRIVDAVNVPVIVCGGAGSAQHVEELLNECYVDAVCAASIFHYHVISKFGAEKRDEGNIEYLKKFVESKNPILKRIDPISVSELKTYLTKSKNRSINLRRSTDLPLKYKKIKYDAITKIGGQFSNVVLVDYGRSNLFSVTQVLKTIDVKVEITNDPEKIIKADKLIIAGVGAFGDGMDGMCRNNLIEPITEFVATGNPILGICLGMQLFLSKGEEFGLHEGFDFIKGSVLKLKEKNENGRNVKVPHIGWNQVKCPAKEEHKKQWSRLPVLKDIHSGDYAYFVHSYMAVPENPDYIVAETDYGPNTFCSIILKENILGCQFHPERSGLMGFKIYKNFIFDL